MELYNPTKVQQMIKYVFFKQVQKDGNFNFLSVNPCNSLSLFPLKFCVHHSKIKFIQYFFFYLSAVLYAHHEKTDLKDICYA